MRYPQKKPWLCTVTNYANGTNYCHNTQQKLEVDSCLKCKQHYGILPPFIGFRNAEGDSLDYIPDGMENRMITKSKELGIGCHE